MIGDRIRADEPDGATVRVIAAMIYALIFTAAVATSDAPTRGARAEPCAPGWAVTAIARDGATTCTLDSQEGRIVRGWRTLP